jgi:hypothetical protein
MVKLAHNISTADMVAKPEPDAFVEGAPVHPTSRAA